MLVRHYMTPNPVTILPTASVEDAFYIMHEKGVHHLPVQDYAGRLVGFVAEHDLLLVSPSPTAAITLHEMLYQLAQVKISSIMTENPITVDADAPLEEAARLMVEHKLDALPVLSQGELVGIITETDIFQVFLEVLDTPVPAVRLSMLIPDEKGVIAYLCRHIAEAGGNILSAGEFHGPKPGTRQLTLRIAEVPLEQVQAIAERAVQERGFVLLDIRECAPAEGAGRTEAPAEAGPAGKE